MEDVAIVYLRNANDVSGNQKHIDDFEKNLYLKYFPNDNEREPFENIVKRIVNGDYPLTEIVLFVIDGNVVAGCVTDTYPECGAIEATYLAVDEKYRNNGMAKRLLDLVFAKDNVIDMYVEVDNPEYPASEKGTMDPKTRIEIYEKLGFRLLNVNYVQPPLGDGKDFEYGLKLMCKTKKRPLGKGRLKRFLTAFYRGLDCLDSDEYRNMIKYL